MWIRSQDKTKLIDVKAIYLRREAYARFYRICTEDLTQNTPEYIELGFYETNKKAMSVLDDLQCRIARSETGVYQMPGDEE